MSCFICGHKPIHSPSYLQNHLKIQHPEEGVAFPGTGCLKCRYVSFELPNTKKHMAAKHKAFYFDNKNAVDNFRVGDLPSVIHTPFLIYYTQSEQWLPLENMQYKNYLNCKSCNAKVEMNEKKIIAHFERHDSFNLHCNRTRTQNSIHLKKVIKIACSKLDCKAEIYNDISGFKRHLGTHEKNLDFPGTVSFEEDTPKMGIDEVELVELGLDKDQLSKMNVLNPVDPFNEGEWEEFLGDLSDFKRAEESVQEQVLNNTNVLSLGDKDDSKRTVSLNENDCDPKRRRIDEY